MTHLTIIPSQATPPSWALRQRHLIEVMNDAGPSFVARYTRRDGTFVWREEWPGFDGSDDGYESYHNWPLFYALGGSSWIHETSRWLWEAVTKQFTAYGQVYREFDANYDWMHHGESSIYFYYFGLADPSRARDVARTMRFAGMYTGEDETADNWDAEHRLMRSPITGSRGPRLVNAWDDWATHRAVLANYPAPFEDIPGVEDPIADWTADAVYGEILRLLNDRQMRCDVPLNLTSTSLVTHAYLYTGDSKWRRWVLDYVEAWAERIEANGGICPDNVGPNGIIGETMDGKWWGGYYGWRWPHGFMSIIQPLTISAMNAVLLTGDMGYLDIPRGQLDRMIAMGRETERGLEIPNRHMDEGWTDFRPVRPEYPIQIWAMSQNEADRERVEAMAPHDASWNEVAPGRGKGDDIHIAPWYRYVTQRNPGYPDRILEAQYAEIARRLDVMAHDDGDPETWDVHHWQNINPVHTEGLLQLACGGPQIIYHGGLLHVLLRYFDLDERRPGLPADVGALVSELSDDGVVVTIANTSPMHERSLRLQAGAFGEHRFTQVEVEGEVGDPRDVGSKSFDVTLSPATRVTLRIGMQRYVAQPSYEQPL